MPERHTSLIATELHVSPARVRAAASLLHDGATLPFIARYRKEATGSLDEVALARIRDRLRQLAALDSRRDAILSSLSKRRLLTPDLRALLHAATTSAALEDAYAGFRPKRHTRAGDAIARGLEPLAQLLLEQDPGVDPRKAARPYATLRGVGIPNHLRVRGPLDALAGARDVIASWIASDATARARVRDLFWSRAILRAEIRKGKELDAATYQHYFRWSRPIANVQSHHYLAIRRAEAAGYLSISLRPPDSAALTILRQLFLKPNRAGASECAKHVRGAITDGYTRLLAPQIETEVRADLKLRADSTAIAVFTTNLRQLLLAPPLGPKRVLAIDPGQRTGCKVAVLDAHGALLAHTVVYPHLGELRANEAADTLTHLVHTHHVQAIAVGSATAGRETLAFARSLTLPRQIPVIPVDESGASVYSTSPLARRELPDLDPTIRSAVSIGRRLVDPLAELVKLDPKTIGVGQYQHDVDQKQLAAALDDTVLSCVASVGVDLNTASPSLLARVPGLSPSLAEAIVSHRTQHGRFKRRRDLLAIPRFGPKAFEQSAGFLRIPNATNPLDNTAVHPESYPVVDRIASDLGLTVADLLADPSLTHQVPLECYVTPSLGLPTLQDILRELARPSRDPRHTFQSIDFAPHIHSLTDVEPGMTLPGIVTNVTHFGAFVAVGLDEPGLLHKSHLSQDPTFDPTTLLHPHQPLHVTVLSIDLTSNRLSLSLAPRSPA